MYVFPAGTVLGGIYYNRAIWQSAGLSESEKDYPKTWDDLGRLAQHLTVRKNGTVQRWGMNQSTLFFAIALEMYYQQGVYAFSPDGRTSQMNNPQMIKAIQTHASFVTKYRAGSFTGTDFFTLLSQGKNAMTWAYPWVPAALKGGSSKVEVGAFGLPTFTGRTTPAEGFKQVDGFFTVMASASPAARDTAFHFLQWLFLTGDRTKTALALTDFDGALPAYKPAQALAKGVGLDVILQRKSRAVPVGDYPPAVSDPMDKAMQQIETAGVQPSVALAQAQHTVNHALALRQYRFTERDYRF